MSINLRNLAILIQKNETLKYTKILKGKRIDMFSSLGITKEMNNINYKGYMKKQLEMKLERKIQMSIPFVALLKKS